MALFGSRIYYPRLRLEILEERTLLNNRFVIPVGLPIDNTTTFSSLPTALNAPGLKANDIIQIELGSTPGNVTGANLTAPGVANLTIQGDPAVPSTLIPLFTLSTAAKLGTAESGFTLKNVNLGLIGSGSLEFDAATSITASSLEDINSTAPTALLFNPGSASGVANRVTNSTLTDAGGATNGQLVEVIPSTATGDPNGDSNVFLNNTFVMSAPATGTVLLLYSGGGNITLETQADEVIGNTFLATVGSSPSALFENLATTGAPLFGGLTVQGNSFATADANVLGIDLDFISDGTEQVTFVLNNTLQLSGAHDVGIDVLGGSLSESVIDAILRNNEISTNLTNHGTGLLINAATSPMSRVVVTAQGNDFHTNQVGVQINVNTAVQSSNLDVDLGGGVDAPFGSNLGDNNFHGLGAATATQGPIIVSGSINSNEPPTINAEYNIFGSSTPLAYTSSSSHVTVATSKALSANAAFVATLYNDFLKRAGDTTNAMDAGYWVTLLNNNTMTGAMVANAILHSSEGLGILVDGLYQKLLNRPSDTGGRAYFVHLLQNGGTVEQVITQIVTSAEYLGQVGSNAAFVESLYIKLLGRIGTNTEVAGGVAQLASQSLATVASGFVALTEFRDDVVEELYGFTLPAASSVANLFLPLLHRTSAPLAGDVNYWVNGGQDLLAMETAFAQTGEFFANG